MPNMQTMPIVHTMPFLTATQCQICTQCHLCSTFGIRWLHIWHCIGAQLALGRFKIYQDILAAPEILCFALRFALKTRVHFHFSVLFWFYHVAFSPRSALALQACLHLASSATLQVRSLFNSPGSHLDEFFGNAQIRKTRPPFFNFPYLIPFGLVGVPNFVFAWKPQVNFSNLTELVNPSLLVPLKRTLEVRLC